MEREASPHGGRRPSTGGFHGREESPPAKSSAATRWALLYFTVATAALVWPVYPWLGNRIEPRVWGLPFSLVWILAIITCNFCVLVLLYRLRLIDDLELDESEPTRSRRGQQ